MTSPLSLHSERARFDSDVNQEWDHLCYTVRVRSTTSPVYLWGSAGISQAPALPANLLLHVRNWLHGEVITIGTTAVGGAQTQIGTLQPGECFSLPLQNIAGVYVSCTLDSRVSCSLRHA